MMPFLENDGGAHFMFYPAFGLRSISRSHVLITVLYLNRVLNDTLSSLVSVLYLYDRDVVYRFCAQIA